MSEEGDRCILYEADHTCGIIYLTIDNTSPIFFDFHHRIKVEVKVHAGKQLPAPGRGLSQEVGNEGTVQEVVRSVGTGDNKYCSNGQILRPSPEIKQEILTFSTQDIGENSYKEEKCNQHQVKNKGNELFTRQIERSTSRKNRKRKEGTKTCSQVETRSKRTQKKTSRNKEKKCVFEKKQTSHRAQQKKDETKQPFENNPHGVSENAEGESNCETDGETGIAIKEEQTVSCEYCQQVFESRRAFYNHRKSQTKLHECSECKKTFPFRGHLLVHMKEHRPKKGSAGVESKRSICDICGLDSKNVTRLKKHMLIHTGEFYYKCCVCDKQISGFGAMNQHMVSHKSAGLIKCNCCEQYFSTRAELSKHQLALLDITCKLCGEVFPNRTSRTVHYKLAHPDNILKCHVCNHMFSSQEELTNHMVYHTKYKKKQCTICGKFVSRLEKHILTHKSLKDLDESDLFICDKCPMKFMLKSSLQRHQRTHTQERPFECYQCPKTFSCRSVLRKHIKSHSSIMPYECEVCGKRCKEKSNLKVHMRTHSDKKAFPCSLCPQAFGYKNSLEAHVRSKHSPAQSTLVPKHDLDQSNNLILEAKPEAAGKECAYMNENINSYRVLPTADNEFAQTHMTRATENFAATHVLQQQDITHTDLQMTSHSIPIDERSLNPCIFPVDPRLAIARSVYSRANHPS